MLPGHDDPVISVFLLALSGREWCLFLTVAGFFQYDPVAQAYSRA